MPDLSPETLSQDAVRILKRLVSFDTVSSRSNLALIADVESYLAELGVTSRVLMNAEGTKANLWATVGPCVEGGVVLSGHTDVVPVEGQLWSSEPFSLEQRDGRLYGRGASDMKGFLAVALATVPAFLAADMVAPVHLAFSYDEEIGCLGAPELIDFILAEGIRPAAVIVGEPTMMRTVVSHKSVHVYEVVVTGKEAHSSLAAEGVSAIMAAIELLAALNAIALDEERMHRDAQFEPAWSTLTVGTITGGAAANILAGECRFTFDLRCLPGRDAAMVLAPFHEAVRRVDQRLAAFGEATGVSVAEIAHVPWLAREEGGVAEALATSLTGTNEDGLAVAYGAEAGQFQGAGFSTVICGPGSIEQAHRADEYVDVSQIEAGVQFMLRLAEHLKSVHDELQAEGTW